MNFPAEREEKRQHRTWPGCRHSGDILTYLAGKVDRPQPKTAQNIWQINGCYCTRLAPAIGPLWGLPWAQAQTI